MRLRDLQTQIASANSQISTLNSQVSSLNHVVAGLQSKPTVLVLASNFPAATQTTVTRADVTGWNFNVVAGKRYRIEVFGTYQTAATTTGGSIGFYLPSGAGTIRGFVSMAILQTNVAASIITTSIHAINATTTTANSFSTSTGVGVINSPHSVMAELEFTCTTSGVFRIQWGTEVANSLATLLANSKVIVQEI